MREERAYPRNNLLDALFVTLHLQKGLNLAHGEVVSIAQSDHLVKGAEKFVGISKNFSLVEGAARAGDNLSEKVQGVNVLKNVGLLVRDEHHVELIKWLVDESDVILLDSRMLGTAVGKLGERGQ